MKKSNDENLVSVIIPCFNHEQYIEAAIVSVFKQTYQNFELIVIDDCSSDSSTEIIRRLQRKYNFIFIKHDLNLGVSKTLNQGVSIANGNFIAFLSSDDYWHQCKLEKQVAYLLRNSNVVACGTKAQLVDSENNFISHFSENLKAGPGVDFQLGFYDFFVRRKTISPSLMFSKNKITLFDDGFLVEDLKLWLDMTIDDQKIGVIDEQLLFYRTHEGNTHKKTKQLVEQHLKIIDCFNNHQLYQKAKYNWSYDSALLLSRKYKIDAIKLFIATAPRSIFDHRMIKLFFKILIQW